MSKWSGRARGGEEARPEYVNTVLVAFVVCPFRKDISLLGGQVAVFWLISCIAGTSVRFSVSASKRYQPLELVVNPR